MFGIKLNKIQSEAISEDLEECEEWLLLSDYMSNKDYFFGKVIIELNNDDYEPYRIIDDLIKECEGLEKIFKEKFDLYFGDRVVLGDIKPKLMLVNHFE